MPAYIPFYRQEWKEEEAGGERHSLISIQPILTATPLFPFTHTHTHTLTEEGWNTRKIGEMSNSILFRLGFFWTQREGKKYFWQKNTQKYFLAEIYIHVWAIWSERFQKKLWLTYFLRGKMSNCGLFHLWLAHYTYHWGEWERGVFSSSSSSSSSYAISDSRERRFSHLKVSQTESGAEKDV